MPIENEKRIIRHVEHQELEEVWLPSSPKVVLTKPTGETDTLDATMSPEEAAIEFEFSAFFEFDGHGVWELRWQFGVGDEVRIRPEWLFVATIDVWRLVRQLLGKTVSEVPDYVVDDYLFFVLRRLERDYECIGANGYTTLEAEDAHFFDMALVYLVAARWANYNPNSLSSGPVRRITQGPRTIEYSVQQVAKSDRSPQEFWVDEAYNQLSMVSCVADELDEFNSGVQLSAFVGPRRGVQDKTLYNQAMIDQLYIISTEEQKNW